LLSRHRWGVGTAFYLTEYTRESGVTKIIRFSAESLAGIPSIVYGLFGFIFFVTYLKLGWSILSGGLTLAVMIFTHDYPDFRRGDTHRATDVP